MTELKLTRTSADRRLYGDRESNVRILPGAANRVQARCTGAGGVAWPHAATPMRPQPQEA